MKIKSLRFSAALAAAALIICAAVLTTATYAWFTFSADTNVEPMQGSVSKGDVNLVISGSANGKYDVSAPITRLDKCTELLPVSTSNLTSFYTASARTRDGIAALYTDVTQGAEKRILHGEVYLKAQYADARLYFDSKALSFSGNSQLLASLRLGMKISGSGEAKTYFFRLDDFAGGSAAAQNTIQGAANSVVSSIDEAGNAAFVTDTSGAMSQYYAVSKGENTDPEAGTALLYTLAKDTPVRVEIWLYLEGCDENCINSAQAKDLSFNIAFAGVAAETAQ